MSEFVADVVDLFAGAGGWDLAARELGFDPLGIENDEHACATRDAAGFRTLQTDIRDIEPIPAVGLIASPPCQTFSSAGKGSGRRNLDLVLEIAGKLVDGADWRALTADLEDERTALVLEPLHWILRYTRIEPYRWVALEQVPPVLPVWEFYAQTLRNLGYSAVTGIVHAEQYGVPQTRKRAVLLASLDREVSIPEPTHSAYYPRDPQCVDKGVEKWVSMAEALGWGMTQRPYPVIASSRTTGGPDKEKVGGSEVRAQIYAERDAGHWQFRQSAMKNATVRDPDQPAPTMTGANDFGERVWMLSAGKTSPETAGTRPRGDDEPSGTITGKGTAAWVHERPSPTVVTTRRSGDGGLVGHQLPEGEGRNVGGRDWMHGRPATTVNGDARISKPGHHDENTSGSQQKDAVRVSIAEAAVLQSLPDDFPWQGTKTAQFRQIGNAVPPLLAYHLLSSVTGISQATEGGELPMTDKEKMILDPKVSKNAKAAGKEHGHTFGRLTVKDHLAVAKCKTAGCAVLLEVTVDDFKLVPDDNGVINCVTAVAETPQAPEPKPPPMTAYALVMEEPEWVALSDAGANALLMGEDSPAQIAEPDGPSASFVPATPTSPRWSVAPPLPMTSILGPDGSPWDPFAELIGLIEGFTQSDDRSMQTLIGPSEIGTDCDRCLGKKLLQIPVTREVAWLPAIGRAVHAWLEHEFRRCEDTCGWTAERKVPIGIVGNRLIKGTCDAFKNGVVVDFKVVGATTLKKVKAQGASGVYRGQGHAYGRGYELEGHEVTHVMVLYLPRNSPTLADAEKHIEPYNRDVALDVLARAQRIYDKITSDPPALIELPRSPDCYDCYRFAPLPGEDSPSTGPHAGQPFAGILS